MYASFNMIVTVSIALLLLPLTVRAAEPVVGNTPQPTRQKLVPPKPLYRGMPGEDFSFVAEYEYKPEKINPKESAAERAVREFNKQAPKIVKLEAVSTGTIRLDTRYYNTGEYVEVWRCGSMRFTRRSYNLNIYDIGDSTNTTDPRDLAELDWITTDTYQGAQTVRGHKFHTYHKDDLIAYVDFMTLMPVKVENDVLVVTFTFGPAPEEPLKIDPRLLTGMKKVRRAWAGVED